MATETKKPRKAAKRGRTAPQSLPDMVTHHEVAASIKVPSDTLRKWVNAEPPVFPKPNLVVGTMWFYERGPIAEYILKGTWPK